MQLELFKSEDPRRVLIPWLYHDAGYFWMCPKCPQRKAVPYVAGFGTSSYELGSEIICHRCGAWYRRIPGDIDQSTRTTEYGYLFLGDAPDMPEVAPE